GNMEIQDPDELIHEIAWKGIHEVEQLCLAFPEDYELLCQYIDKEASM
ncbi:DNA mismatch repair protein MutT, partial [Bacillus cereus]